MVQVLNMSTGHYPKGGTSKVAGQVTSLTFDSTGKTLWAGDDKVSCDQDWLGTKYSMMYTPLLFLPNTHIHTLGKRTWCLSQLL